jgi:hypothetical protein
MNLFLQTSYYLRAPQGWVFMDAARSTQVLACQCGGLHANAGPLDPQRLAHLGYLAMMTREAERYASRRLYAGNG